MLASDKNPMSRAYIRQSTIVEDTSIKITSEVLEKLDKKYRVGKDAAMIAGRKLIGGLVKKFGGKTVLKKVTGSSLGKLAGAAAPALSGIMLAYDIGSMVINSEAEVKKILLRKKFRSFL